MCLLMKYSKQIKPRYNSLCHINGRTFPKEMCLRVVESRWGARQFVYGRAEGMSRHWVRGSSQVGDWSAGPTLPPLFVWRASVPKRYLYPLWKNNCFFFLIASSVGLSVTVIQSSLMELGLNLKLFFELNECAAEEMRTMLIWNRPHCELSKVCVGSSPSEGAACVLFCRWR